MTSGPATTLLLLPPIPSPPTYSALKAAFYAPLRDVLRSLNSSKSVNPPSSARPSLDIGLTCPHLHRHRAAARQSQFAVTQLAVANVYKLVCIISAQNGYDVEGADGLDVRVLLIAYHAPHSAPSSEGNEVDSSLLGPVVSLSKLASSGRTWDVAYGISNEQGEAVVQEFQRHCASAEVKLLSPPGPPYVPDVDEDSYADSPSDTARHFSVANGGTFDHLHVGHKLLLTMTAFALDVHVGIDAASSQAKRVITIGLTAEDLLKNKKYAEFLESWHERYQVVDAFLRSIIDFSSGDRPPSVNEVMNPGPNGHAIVVTFPSGLEIRYVEIWDACGPTITDAEISALVLSGETRGGGKYVNDKRKEVGFAPLEVFEIDVLDALEVDDKGVDEQFHNKLSSTEIRKARSLQTAGKSKV